MKIDNLEQHVHAALDNAKDNDYLVFLMGSVQEVADDLLEYCPEFEECMSEDVFPHIVSWQLKQGVSS